MAKVTFQGLEDVRVLGPEDLEKAEAAESARKRPALRAGAIPSPLNGDTIPPASPTSARPLV